MDGWVDELVNECVDEWMDGWKDYVYPFRPMNRWMCR